MEMPVRISFRGLEHREDLARAARGWIAAIAERLSRAALSDARVHVYRCGPEWGGSTTAQVEVTIDGERLVEFARHQDPGEALQSALAKIATRARPSAFGGPAAIGAWS